MISQLNFRSTCISRIIQPHYVSPQCTTRRRFLLHSMFFCILFHFFPCIFFLLFCILPFLQNCSFRISWFGIFTVLMSNYVYFKRFSRHRSGSYVCQNDLALMGSILDDAHIQNTIKVPLHENSNRLRVFPPYIHSNDLECCHSCLFYALADTQSIQWQTSVVNECIT